MDIKLTDREKDVVKLIASGYETKEIAQKLGLAEQSINVYTSRIYRLLNVDETYKTKKEIVKERAEELDLI